MKDTDIISLEAEDISDVKALLSLLDKENVELITELPNPVQITVVEAVIKDMKHSFYPQCSNIFETYVSLYKKNMISNKRKSRVEFIEALKNLKQSEKEGLPNDVVKKQRSGIGRFLLGEK